MASTINSKQILDELDEVLLKQNQLSANTIATNAASAASYLALGQSVGALSAHYAGLSGMVTAANISLTAFNALSVVTVTQLATVSAAITALNTNILGNIVGWDTLTQSINNNSLALGLNTLMSVLSSAAILINSAITTLASACMSEYTDNIKENSEELLINTVLSLVSGLALVLNAFTCNLANAQFEKMNEGISAINELYKELTPQLLISSIFTGMQAAALMLHKAALDRENKSLTSNTSRTTSNNKRQAAAIGLKGMQIGAMAGFPAGLALAPAMGVLFAGTALGIIKMGMSALATGGVATGPTVALVGEGRYPEAVVPLGNSPQFASMKDDIANAVLRGILALRGSSEPKEPSTLVLNVDGEKLARVIIPKINKENGRKGYVLQTKGV